MEISAKIVPVFQTFSELKKNKNQKQRNKVPKPTESWPSFQSAECGSRCLCLNSSHCKRRHMYLCIFEIAVFPQSGTQQLSPSKVWNI